MPKQRVTPQRYVHTADFVHERFGGAGASEKRLLRRPLPHEPLPSRTADAIVSDLGDETLVFNLRDQRAHSLNSVASSVWKHLDGGRTVDDLTLRVSEDLGHPVSEATVWETLEMLDGVDLLDGKLEDPDRDHLTRRQALGRLAAAAAGGVMLAPAISTMLSSPASAAAVSGSTCAVADTCQTFTCAGGCACVTTTEGTKVCIVPTCVAPCTTTADCPPGTVCFTLGCCGPATFCVPIAAPGTNCVT